MTITMGSAAISSADPEMTSSDTTPVTRMATKLAWKAGWALNVTMLFADKAVVQSMGLANSQVTAGASMAGRACTVTNVSRTQGASMAPVTSPGSASVRPTGAVSSATKISITAGLTSRVLIGELVATRVLTNTSVPALTAIQDPTVKLQSMPASLIPATTEAAARRPPWGLSVSVLQAGRDPPAPQTLMTVLQITVPMGAPAKTWLTDLSACARLSGLAKRAS